MVRDLDRTTPVGNVMDPTAGHPHGSTSVGFWGRATSGPPDGVPELGARDMEILEAKCQISLAGLFPGSTWGDWLRAGWRVFLLQGRRTAKSFAEARG